MTAISADARRIARRARWYKMSPRMWHAEGELHHRDVAFVHLEWHWWITGQLHERIADGIAPTCLDAQRASDAYSIQRLQAFAPIWQGYARRPSHPAPKRYAGPDSLAPTAVDFWSCESRDVSSCVGRDGRWTVSGLSGSLLYMRGQAVDHHVGIRAAEMAINAAIVAEIAAIQDPLPAPVIPAICHGCRQWWRWWPDRTTACACARPDPRYHDLRQPCDVCAPLFVGAAGAANLAACRILGDHQYETPYDKETPLS